MTLTSYHDKLIHWLPNSDSISYQIPVSYKNSSGDEIANVNFFYDDNFNHFAQCAPEATEFGEITQNKGHYAIQGHLRSPIFVPIETHIRLPISD